MDSGFRLTEGRKARSKERKIKKNNDREQRIYVKRESETRIAIVKF